MKKIEIKVGCFYRNDKSGHKRFVVGIFTPNKRERVYYIDMRLNAIKNCTTKTFANWLSCEVVPSKWRRYDG